MKYKKGDKVRIKSQKWYDENKDKYGIVNVGGVLFQKQMRNCLGKEVTIKCAEKKYNYYTIDEYNYGFSEEMFEDSTELNLIEKLKDCPKGTKLYSPIFGEIEFFAIDEFSSYPITVEARDNYGNKYSKSFTKEGFYVVNYSENEQLLFPSKENRDWSTFINKADLEINTPCVVFDRIQDNGKPYKPQVRDYAGNHRVYSYDNDTSSPKNPFKYIIPHYKYDFKNKSFNVDDNYGLIKNK